MKTQSLSPGKAILAASFLVAATLMASCAKDPFPTMVDAKGGSFRQGGTNEDERPVHTVSLSPFAIGKTEVTVAQFRAFIEATGYETTAELLGTARGIKDGLDSMQEGFSWRNPGFAQAEDEPAVCLSWYDACAYCNWLSARAGLEPAYSSGGTSDFMAWKLAFDDASKDSFAVDKGSKGYRLPTEAEWEFAARGGMSSALYPYAGGDELEALAWYWGNSGDKSHPVAKLAPNELGIHDMSGNAWEWCYDWWGYYSEETQFDPLGAEGGHFRTMRGGGWYGAAGMDYSYIPFYRGKTDPAERSSAIGFRVAKYE